MTTATKSEILFEDGIYSDELVARINAEVTSGKTALQIWAACVEALFEEEGDRGFDTAPCELLLAVLDARGTRGFPALARRFGYIPRGLAAIDPYTAAGGL